jgi:hypothetical protein
MKVRFTSVGDEFIQALFFTSLSIHPRFSTKHANNNTNAKKKIEKKLNTFEVMVEKPILTNPLGEWRHVVGKIQKLLP